MPKTTRIFRTSALRRKKRGSLRRKLVMMSTGIIAVTSILSFAFIYTKSAGHLDKEINEMGYLMLKALSSLDPEYWLRAMYRGAAMTSKDPAERLSEIIALTDLSVSGDNPNLNIDAIKKDPQALMTYTNLRTNYKSSMQGYDTLKKLYGGLKLSEFNSFISDLKSLINNERVYDRLTGSEDYKKFVETVFTTASQFNPFETLRSKNQIGFRAVREISVGYFPPNHASKEPLKTISLNQIPVNFRQFRNISVDGVEAGEELYVSEGVVVEMSGSQTREVPARAFRTTQVLPSGGKLVYWLVMSISSIKEAKSELQFSMLIPAFIALAVGIAAAVMFSYYISSPLKVLIDDIATVSKGDLSHHSKVSTNDEIGMLAETFNEMTSLLKIAHEREVQQAALEHELSIARQIQANLLPKEKFEYEDTLLDALYKPSKEVGGDYYDYFKIDDNNVGVVVADVSGKGVPASIIMSMFRILLRTEAIDHKNTSTHATLVRVNDILAKDMKKGMFVTAFYLIIDIKEKMVTLSSAGHNPIYMIRSSDKKLYSINPGGLALGIYSGKLFVDSLKEARIPFGVGDSIMAYTDGVVECTNDNYEFFGEERLKKLFYAASSKEPQQAVRLIYQELMKFQGDSDQHDDITFVNIKRVK